MCLLARDLLCVQMTYVSCDSLSSPSPPPHCRPQLICVNSPDLVLFVGEALVGNEAVDQLDKFNQALVDHSDDTNPWVMVAFHSQSSTPLTIRYAL